MKQRIQHQEQTIQQHEQTIRDLEQQRLENTARNGSSLAHGERIKLQTELLDAKEDALIANEQVKTLDARLHAVKQVGPGVECIDPVADFLMFVVAKGAGSNLTDAREHSCDSRHRQ